MGGPDMGGLILYGACNGGPGVCLVIKRAEPMFNKKVEVLNRYLSVVVDRPRVFV